MILGFHLRSIFEFVGFRVILRHRAHMTKGREDHDGGGIGLAYPLVKVDCVFSGDDITDGGSTFLAAGGLLGLGLWVVFNHFGGLPELLVDVKNAIVVFESHVVVVLLKIEEMATWILRRECAW